MATQKLTIVRDDLTGEEIPPGQAKTVPLVFGAEAWELDLSLESHRKVREMLEPIVDSARRAKPSKPNRVPGNQNRAPARIDREQRRAVRTWWQGNHRKAKLPKPNPAGRGRIPGVVMEAYQQHGGAKV